MFWLKAAINSAPPFIVLSRFWSDLVRQWTTDRLIGVGETIAMVAGASLIYCQGTQLQRWVADPSISLNSPGPLLPHCGRGGVLRDQEALGKGATPTAPGSLSQGCMVPHLPPTCPLLGLVLLGHACVNSAWAGPLKQARPLSHRAFPDKGHQVQHTTGICQCCG